MPRPQPLRELLESLAASGGPKRLTGTIADPAALLQARSVVALDARHDGSFVLFVHDPTVDADLATYLASGALANDGGRALFTLYEPARPAVADDSLAAFGVAGVAAPSPVVDFATTLFGAPRTVPGLLALGRLAGPTSAVYVPLAPIEGRPVAERVRELLRLIAEATHPGADDVLDARALGVALALRGIAYDSTRPTSVDEAFSKMLGFLWAHKSDVVGVVKTAITLKTGG